MRQVRRSFLEYYRLLRSELDTILCASSVRAPKVGKKHERNATKKRKCPLRPAAQALKLTLASKRRSYPRQATVWDVVERSPQTAPTTSTYKTVREVIIRYGIGRITIALPPPPRTAFFIPTHTYRPRLDAVRTPIAIQQK